MKLHESIYEQEIVSDDMQLPYLNLKDLHTTLKCDQMH